MNKGEVLEDLKTEKLSSSVVFNKEDVCVLLEDLQTQWNVIQFPRIGIHHRIFGDEHENVGATRV